jgi:hypothetical protein
MSLGEGSSCAGALMDGYGTTPAHRERTGRQRQAQERPSYNASTNMHTIGEQAFHGLQRSPVITQLLILCAPSGCSAGSGASQSCLHGPIYVRIAAAQTMPFFCELSCSAPAEHMPYTHVFLYFTLCRRQLRSVPMGPARTGTRLPQQPRGQQLTLLESAAATKAARSPEAHRRC